MESNILEQNNSTTPLHQLAYILQQLADELLLDKVGIGLSQARIIGVLTKFGAKSQRLIAAQLGQTEANISRQLQLMKEDGLVTISKNSKDKRQRDVLLTTRGSHIRDKANKLLLEQQTELLKLLVGSSEIEEFILMTERLLRVLYSQV